VAAYIIMCLLVYFYCTDRNKKNFKLRKTRRLPKHRVSQNFLSKKHLIIPSFLWDSTSMLSGKIATVCQCRRGICGTFQMVNRCSCFVSKLQLTC
jgi:hypothetical protein